MNEKLKHVTARVRRLTHRIAALLSALMIAVTAMPAITAMADDERTINITTSVKFLADDKYVDDYGTYSNMIINDWSVTGSGNFVMVTYYISLADDECYHRRCYLLSNSSFDLSTDRTIGSSKDNSVVTYSYTANSYNGVYYYCISSTNSSAANSVVVVSGLANYRQTDDIYNQIFTDIDAGYFDLSRDDYLSDEDFEFDEDNATYDSSIPTPNVSINSYDYLIGFNNSTDDYLFQIKGRWYSVDDIELYKSNFMWKYKYYSIIKNSLTDWSNGKLYTTKEYTLCDLGADSFNNLLSLYPIDDREYTGGTNAVGNYFSGYNNALSTLKMLLAQSSSLYNGFEVYIRYYVINDDGSICYGRWCHLWNHMADASGSSGSQIDDEDDMFTTEQSQDGLTDDMLDDLEETGDSKGNDKDTTSTYDDSYDEGSILFGDDFDFDASDLTDMVNTLYSQSLTYVSFFQQIFSFLPSWLISFIVASLAVMCLIGIWRMFRG